MMNGIKLPDIRSRRSLLVIFAIVMVVLLVRWVVGGYTQNALGLSGAIEVASPPRFALSQEDRSMVTQSGYTGSMGASADALYPSPIPPPFPETPPESTAMIVKSGELSLLVSDVDETARAIMILRARLGGEQGDTSFNEYSPGHRSGYLTIWVPVDRFDEAMVELKKLAVRVENEAIHATDVSTQYVDTEARLKNLRSAESQYMEIMKRAGTITEVLSVTQALNTTRGEIERLQAELNLLSRRVALSSIRITLAQEANPTSVTNDWKPMVVAKSALKNTLNDLTNFVDTMIIFLIQLPILLLNIALWGVILWLLWKVAHFIYRKVSASFLTPPHSPEDVV